jgi:hypothetical protein
MKCIGIYTDCSEFVTQFISTALGTNECNTTTFTSCNGANHCELVTRFNQENVVFHRGNRCSTWFGCMFCWVAEVSVNDCINTAVKSCTEQQTLSAARDELHQVTDDWQEAHVSHLIGFVKNCNFNFTEIACATVDQVFETTRCCNNNICTA